MPDVLAPVLAVIPLSESTSLSMDSGFVILKMSAEETPNVTLKSLAPPSLNVPILELLLAVEVGDLEYAPCRPPRHVLGRLTGSPVGIP